MSGSEAVAPSRAAPKPSWWIRLGSALTFQILVVLGLLVVVPVILYTIVPAFDLGRPQHDGRRLLSWLTDMGLLVLLLMVLGRSYRGRWSGLLISEYNQMSLSRLQIAIWTVVVVSALGIAAFTNWLNGQLSPLDISIPTTLWAALGISVASAATTAMVQNAKSGASGASTMVGNPNLQQVGVLVMGTHPKAAQFGDILRGDEAGNWDTVDLTKTQMLLFTIVLVGVYAATLGSLLFNLGSIRNFPAIDQSVVTLFAVSHVGYAANKAAPHTPPPTAHSQH